MGAPLPTIGSRGSFTAKAPYDTIILPTDVYVCKGIRRLSDYLAMNEDPKSFIYQHYGMTEADYETDLKDDIEIVSLQSDKGAWVYIPANRLLTYPLVNGVEYRAKSVVIKLPLIKESIDLTPMVSDLSEVVRGYLGIVPAINVVNITRPTLMTKEASDTLETTRASSADTDRTMEQKIISYQNTITDLQNKLTELEEYIKTTLP